MSQMVILSPAADRELEEAAAWYEREVGRGEAFVERIQEALDRIRETPELHPKVYRDIRRVRVPRFPYNVFYRNLPDRVEVIADLHKRRDPNAWQSRAYLGNVGAEPTVKSNGSSFEVLTLPY
jgi:toxin ParE1/3/4